MRLEVDGKSFILDEKEAKVLLDTFKKEIKFSLSEKEKFKDEIKATALHYIKTELADILTGTIMGPTDYNLSYEQREVCKKENIKAFLNKLNWENVSLESAITQAALNTFFQKLVNKNY